MFISRKRAQQCIAAFVLLSWSYYVLSLLNRVAERNSAVKEGASFRPPQSFSQRFRPKRKRLDGGTHTGKMKSTTAEYDKGTSNGEACSCENDLGNRCCLRGFIGVHKMGLTATHIMRRKHFPLENTIELSNNRFGDNFRNVYLHPEKNDYRMVVVTRNWYDAFISGYLYHKAGKECWLDHDGRGGYYNGWFTWLSAKRKGAYRGWLLYENWEERIQSSYEALPWPPGKGRDLCSYLGSVSESSGMRVYVEWALSSYMRPLLEFAHVRKDAELKSGRNRTLFLCYEQLTNPESYVPIVHSISDWLYPGSRYSKNGPAFLPKTAPSKKYNGGHGTSHDRKLRQRLRRIIERLDNQLYNGTLSIGSSEFACEAERLSL